MQGMSSPQFGCGCVGAALLANSEDFRAAGRAQALGRRSAVLHRDSSGVADFFLGAALHAVCLHIYLLSREKIIGHYLVDCQ